MIGDVYPPVKYQLGRPLKYTPQELLEEFAKYVDWAREHPITVGSCETSTNAKGESWSKEGERTLPRLVSIGGFLVHIGGSESWWSHLEDGLQKEDFFKVKSFIREYCEQYQKEMASTDLFNANIISRLLGLADRKEIKAECSGEMPWSSKEELRQRLKEING